MSEEIFTFLFKQVDKLDKESFVLIIQSNLSRFIFHVLEKAYTKRNAIFK